MTRILVIDDEPINHILISQALEPLGFLVEVTSNGEEGLKLAKASPPDLIITDVIMPGMDGYDLTRTLRRDPRFAHVPILVLTCQSELSEKLKAFEAGADDHMVKPFEQAELAARLKVLIKRSETARAAQDVLQRSQEQARVIAIHSLRGGVGGSSLAVNLAMGLAELWGAPTLLMDLVLSAGQVALMTGSNLSRTWADLAGTSPFDLDFAMLQSVVTETDYGMKLIAAPTFPKDAETLKKDLLDAVFSQVQFRFEYFVTDLPHDFSEVTLSTLDVADVILLLIAPELSSIRAAVAAMETYAALGYSSEKLKVVVNATFPRLGLTREKIEAAIGLPIVMGLPYTPDKLVEAINLGKPYLALYPNDTAAAMIEDFAFYLSKEKHRKYRPAEASLMWKRVAKRYNERRGK